ncbi:MAG: hypothetical protein IJF83_05790 [Methanobrevibacter sp.]|nr:hypothetical protein [Methanobrevibacter sp.]
MKTIVTSAFSSGRMINSPEYTLHGKKITEKEFQEKAKKALSFIGHRGVANRYGLQFNRSRISLVPGDQVYVVYIHGGRLPENGDLPSDVSLTFEHVEIVA